MNKTIIFIRQKHHLLIYLLFVAYILSALLTILLANGIGGEEDSIYHYMFARYAPEHPKLFFDHWAKPLYVLLAAPFAQIGFVGIKIFNTLNALLCFLFCWQSARLFPLKNTLLLPLFLMLVPYYFILTFTGLTEPLFAMMLSFSLFLSLKKRFIPVAILISFLPFVRSEGLIILGVFAFYLVMQKRWKYLPLLLVGHIIYSIAGYFVTHDILWVFTKIPYAHLGSIYGEGRLFHFVDQLLYVIGVPMFLLFWIGNISLIVRLFKKGFDAELHIFVWLGFWAFFIAHSLFWYLGIFNSMGLKRVLIAVVPFIGIIALEGFNFASSFLIKTNKLLGQGFQIAMIAYILIFPFTKNPGAIHWQKDLMLSERQIAAKEMANELAATPNKDSRFFHAQPLLSLLLGIDHFGSQRMQLSKDYGMEIQSGDLIIWDNWFCPIEYGLTKDALNKDTRLQKLFEQENKAGAKNSFYLVYRVK